VSQPDDRRRGGGRGGTRARVLAELRRVRPVARTRLSRGTVVWARIPFVDDPDGSKLRPAVVAAIDGRTVTVLPITSSQKDSVRQSASSLYVLLRDWADAGLTRPCLVTRRFVDIDTIDVATVAGELSTRDRERVFGAAQPADPPATS
jgi:hypothetical protein